MSTPSHRAASLAAASLRARLPQVAPDEVEQLRRLAARRRRWIVAQGAAAVELTAEPTSAAPWIALAAGDERVAIAFAQDGLRDAIGEMEWSDYEGESRLTAWALAHERVLAWLGDLVGHALLPVEVGEAGGGGVTIGFRIALDDGQACTGVLAMPSAWLERLLDDPRAIAAEIGPARSEALGALPGTLSMLVDGPALSVAELGTLVAGDVLVIGSRDAALENIRLVGAEEPWRARWQERRLVLIEPRPSAGEMPWRPAMNRATQADDAHTRDDAQDAQDGRKRSIDDVPVRIDFALGELTVAIGELGRLEPGHVFEVGGDFDSANVAIRANGKRIGRGQLVAVGDTLGVRLTDWDADGLL